MPRNNIWKRRSAILLLGSGLSSGVAAGEDRNGSIAGRVTDESGSALPGVTVEARAAVIATGRVAVTDRAGSYAFTDLPAGAYDLSFRLPNFAGVTRGGVGLPGGAAQSVDVVLHLAVTADVVVTGKKTFPNLADIADAGESLIGVAAAASQGTVSGRQIDARPVLRPGEVLETVPGLLISQHSGEGKANQYYLRGFNLDHGTDFATTVAGIPVNMSSHAHGQGYSDLNFVIPELVSGVQYQKGPYAAEQGDFSTAGSASIRYVNELEKGIARAGGAEVGLRSVLAPHVQTTVSFWGLDIGSELVFMGDAGTTEPSRPSRRAGIELASYWSPLPAFVFDAYVALSRARFRDSDPAGDRIPGAVETVVSAGASVEDLPGFSGSLRVRYFGPRPLIEDNSVRSKSSTIVNARIGYGLRPGVRLALDLFNVANARVSDADYFYASRLPGEPAAGVNDIHTHPVEPRSARVSVLYSF